MQPVSAGLAYSGSWKAESSLKDGEAHVERVQGKVHEVNMICQCCRFKCWSSNERLPVLDIHSRWKTSAQYGTASSASSRPVTRVLREERCLLYHADTSGLELSRKTYHQAIRVKKFQHILSFTFPKLDGILPFFIVVVGNPVIPLHLGIILGAPKNKIEKSFTICFLSRMDKCFNCSALSAVIAAVTWGEKLPHLSAGDFCSCFLCLQN